MKIFILFSFVMLAAIASAQSLSEFTYLGDRYGNDELYIGLNPTYSFLSNKAAPNPDIHSISGFSGDLSLRRVNFDQGSLSWNWQHKMILDVFLLVGKAVKQLDASELNRAQNTSITCGIIGWLDFTWAINKPQNRFQLSAGINHHDYFYASTYAVDTIPGQNWASFDPQGYYFSAGPTLKANYLLSSAFMLEVSSSYSISYWRATNLTYATNPSDDYPLPHFGQVDVELQTKWGAFAGVNYNWINNRGNIPSDGKRLDLIFGFRFMI